MSGAVWTIVKGSLPFTDHQWLFGVGGSKGQAFTVGKVTDYFPAFPEKVEATIVGRTFQNEETGADLLVIAPDIFECFQTAPFQGGADIERASQELLSPFVRSVLVTGFNSDSEHIQDFWCDTNRKCWFTAKVQDLGNTSSRLDSLPALAALRLFQGFDLLESVTMARLGLDLEFNGPVSDDLPWMTDTSEEGLKPKAFTPVSPDELGFYLIVDSVAWLERMLRAGVRTLQLRIKDLRGAELDAEIARGVALAEEFEARLYINDHWELAIKHQAYGVHLGHEDLANADCDALRKAGLRLGLSTHCFAEAVRAHGARPSYLAFGPIFHTAIKVMRFGPQGLGRLKIWRNLWPYPLVAIGGIFESNLDFVLECGVDGIAVITAVIKSPEPEATALRFLEIVNHRRQTVEQR